MKLKIILLSLLIFNCYSSSGTCGVDCQWSFTGSTLTISGSGAMDNYQNNYAQIPWYNKKPNIEKIPLFGSSINRNYN